MHSHLLSLSLPLPAQLAVKFRQQIWKRKALQGTRRLAWEISNWADIAAQKSCHFCLTHLAKISFALSRSAPLRATSGLFILSVFYLRFADCVLYVYQFAYRWLPRLSNRGINCSDCARFVACVAPFIIFQMRHHMHTSSAQLCTLSEHIWYAWHSALPRPWKCFQLEQVIHFVATSKVSTNENFKNAYSLRAA